MKKLLIFGMGYSAQYIAQDAVKAGFSVLGTCRSQEKYDKLKKLGLDVVIFDGQDSGFRLNDALHKATHILSSIPPQENGDVVLSLLEGCKTKWLGYLSTTGVYGNWDGAWVDETSELRPNSNRLKRRVKAEEEWLARGGHVFRLAGIYGHGRNALDNMRGGNARRIDKAGQVFSRIHVEDIAQTVLASMLAPHPGEIYNICDDKPVPAHEVVAYAASLLGMKPPPLVPFSEAGLSVMGKEFYSANRRVRNSRIKNELGIMLKYPTYREGLSAIMDMA